MLERGRRWEPEGYPRQLDGDWIWDQDHPDLQHGWFDFRVFPNMAVVQGAGVGGGSLVYTNISINAKCESFLKGWPPEITFEELRPYYERAGAVLDVQKVPYEQWPERTRLVKEAARKKGWGDRFEPLDLAVTFDPDWRYNLPDPHNPSHSKTFTNAHGRRAGHLRASRQLRHRVRRACEEHARRNYLDVAENHGAEIRAAPSGHSASNRPPAVATASRSTIRGRALTAGMRQTASLVVLGRGVARVHRTAAALPRPSARRCRSSVQLLGGNWSSNGDFLTPAIYPFKDPPVIQRAGRRSPAAIDFLNGDGNGHVFFIEDGGFPGLGVRASRWLGAVDPGGRVRDAKPLYETVAALLRETSMFWSNHAVVRTGSGRRRTESCGCRRPRMADVIVTLRLGRRRNQRQRSTRSCARTRAGARRPRLAARPAHRGSSSGI